MMDLPVRDWLLIGLLIVAAIMVILAISVYFSPRPVYNADEIARGSAPAERAYQDKHHQQDGYGTARLKPPPSVHPKNLE